MNKQLSETEIISSNKINEDFALIELSDRRVFFGRGPFTRSAEPSKNDVSFYVNDFNLSSTVPWYIPSSYEEIDFAEITKLSNNKPLPKLQWDEPHYEDFKQCFDQITDLRVNGSLQKIVPAVISSAPLVDPSSYCFNFINSSFPHLPSLSAYGFSENGQGFVGLSPEQIFKLNSSELQTMALAGTSNSDNNTLFENDDKELHEHQLVVDSLNRRLNFFGSIQESQREILDIGGMIHFLSKFSVTLSKEHKIDDIIRALHPTPALGTVPRPNATIDLLNQFRSDFNVPPMFGSPFGIKIGNFFESIVLIRGLFFTTNSLQLPTGCGIVEGSLIDKEWDELAFKSRWVKSSLGLNQ